MVCASTSSGFCARCCFSEVSAPSTSFFSMASVAATSCSLAVQVTFDSMAWSAFCSSPVVRSTSASAAPATNPPMCAQWATPLDCPNRTPDSNSCASHSGSRANAGALNLNRISRKPNRKNHIILIFVFGKRTRNAPISPAMAPEAPSDGTRLPEFTIPCTAVARNPHSK